MTATLQNKSTTNRYNFDVDWNGKTYNVVIWLNEKGKFIDEEVEFNGELVDDDIAEEITDYIADNWDTLVGA